MRLTLNCARENSNNRIFRFSKLQSCSVLVDRSRVDSCPTAPSLPLIDQILFIMKANPLLARIQFQALLNPESTKALWNVREKCFPGVLQRQMSNKDQRKVFGLKLDNIPVARETILSI